MINPVAQNEAATAASGPLTKGQGKAGQDSLFSKLLAVFGKNMAADAAAKGGGKGMAASGAKVVLPQQNGQTSGQKGTLLKTLQADQASTGQAVASGKLSKALSKGASADSLKAEVKIILPQQGGQKLSGQGAGTLKGDPSQASQTGRISAGDLHASGKALQASSKETAANAASQKKGVPSKAVQADQSPAGDSVVTEQLSKAASHSSSKSASTNAAHTDAGKVASQEQSVKNPSDQNVRLANDVKDGLSKAAPADRASAKDSVVTGQLSKASSQPASKSAAANIVQTDTGKVAPQEQNVKNPPDQNVRLANDGFANDVKGNASKVAQAGGDPLASGKASQASSTQDDVNSVGHGAGKGAQPQPSGHTSESPAATFARENVARTGGKSAQQQGVKQMASRTSEGHANDKKNDPKNDSAGHAPSSGDQANAQVVAAATSYQQVWSAAPLTKAHDGKVETVTTDAGKARGGKAEVLSRTQDIPLSGAAGRSSTEKHVPPTKQTENMHASSAQNGVRGSGDVAAKGSGQLLDTQEKQMSGSAQNTAASATSNASVAGSDTSQGGKPGASAVTTDSHAPASAASGMAARHQTAQTVAWGATPVVGADRQAAADPASNTRNDVASSTDSSAIKAAQAKADFHPSGAAAMQQASVAESAAGVQQGGHSRFEAASLKGQKQSKGGVINKDKGQAQQASRMVSSGGGSAHALSRNAPVGSVAASHASPLPPAPDGGGNSGAGQQQLQNSGGNAPLPVHGMNAATASAIPRAYMAGAQAGAHTGPWTAMMAMQETGFQASQGKTSIELTLTPAHLGKIKVQLKSDSQKSVQVHMVVDQATSRQVIQQHLPILRQTLEQHGLNLGQFSMSSQHQQGDSGGGGQQQHASGQPSESRGGAAVASAPMTASRTIPQGDSRLSIHI